MLNLILAYHVAIWCSCGNNGVQSLLDVVAPFEGEEDRAYVSTLDISKFRTVSLFLIGSQLMSLDQPLLIVVC
jgi:hypothetical protein